MKTFTARACATLLAALLFTSTAAAAERIASVATLPGYSPFCFYTEYANDETWVTVAPGKDTSVFQGYSWDVVRESFHAVGYTLRLRIVPWARAMYELRNAKVDLLFPAGRNAERLEYMDYSEEPVNAVNFLIYTASGSGLEWTGLSGLSGRTIGAARGWNFGDQWKAETGFERQFVDSIEQGFSMLDQDRIDGFAGYEVVWDYKLREMGRSGEYRKLPPFDQTREYLTALKTNERGGELLAAFDRGRRIIETNGTMAAIEARWR